MEPADYRALQEELEHYRGEREQIRRLVEQIGGQRPPWQHRMINTVFIAAIAGLFLLDLLHEVWHVPIPIPPIFSAQLGILLISVKIIWMIGTQTKVDHFQFWILNSIEFRLSDLGKRMRQIEKVVAAEADEE